MTTQRKRTARKGDGPALNYILANEKTAVNLKSRKDIAVLFHPISDPPDTAGRYCALTQTGDIETYDYTVDGGWNTFWDTGAEDIYREHAMTAEQIGIIAWAPAVPGCMEVEE